MKTEVTKSVAMRPRQAKTTAAMGSGSPQRTYCTGIGSQPEGRKGGGIQERLRGRRDRKVCGYFGFVFMSYSERMCSCVFAWNTVIN